MNIKYLYAGIHKKTVAKSEAGSRWLEMFQQHVMNASNINTEDAAAINHLSAGYIPRKKREKKQ